MKALVPASGKWGSYVRPLVMRKELSEGGTTVHREGPRSDQQLGTSDHEASGSVGVSEGRGGIKQVGLALGPSSIGYMSQGFARSPWCHLSSVVKNQP